VLWTDSAAAVSDSFRELLLELAQQRSLQDLLPLITRRLAEHEDVALARLWLLEPADQCASCPNQGICADRTRCLHLAASAGRSREDASLVHQKLDGAFRRIPVGAFKVGQVAATRALLVVSDPAHDPQIRHRAWIEAEKIVGFAGLPLSCQGELLGVLGVFVRTALSPAALDVMHILANHAAAAIVTARAFARAEQMSHKLAIENQLLRRSVAADGFEDLVGHSPALLAMIREIEAVAPTDASVLVQGESGTGKELVARALHLRSRREGRPFIEVNCAAIPRELCESELFGHVRDAFSGAGRDRTGRFEAASGGTLFLDEVGELPLGVQGKLLRVLQEGTFARVGEGRTRHADVRLIAGSNRDLLADVESGRFRQDLYYRLAVYPIRVPPLRARKEDLPDLAAHLLVRICRRMHRPLLSLSPEQLLVLARHHWPGNVRELRDVLERAVIAHQDDQHAGRLPLSLGTEHTPPRRSVVTAASGLEGLSPHDPTHALVVLSDAEMRRRERQNLRAALEHCHGKIYGEDGAAALLGLKPTTLASRLKRLLPGPRASRQA
jgi:transcriptional regulator with GAF, ATPase, and Fis domain